MLHHTNDISIQNLWMILVKPPLCEKWSTHPPLHDLRKITPLHCLTHTCVRPLQLCEALNILGILGIPGVINFLGYLFVPPCRYYSPWICAHPRYIALWCGAGIYIRENLHRGYYNPRKIIHPRVYGHLKVSYSYHTTANVISVFTRLGIIQYYTIKLPYLFVRRYQTNSFYGRKQLIDIAVFSSKNFWYYVIGIRYFSNNVKRKFR